ncbi:hypothetical protein [Streptomyces reniochalinae]|uniref:Uncharacterized protein n=1 Tax=Streptomyces reniochalinae TaxID=2250578 RepID=A0A367EII8_9ACTN|nr:hypothetical protein [Streptomyces reniochalinae]RCG17187.1 hypothetical protein DQ392_19355 [Streptomyces reniochalinae]
MPSKRLLRDTLLTVLAVALVAAGVAGGALWQRKEPKKFSEVSADTCHTVLLGLSASVLDRVVPTSHDVSGWQKVTRKKGEYSSLCRIDADGERALQVSVKQRNAASPLDRITSDPVRKVSGFKESWSTQSGAAAALPCTEEKKPDENTELHVTVESFAKKGQDVRKDLERILKAAAKTNHRLACYAAPMEDGSAYD